jgi:hypothetical protein
VAMPGWVWHVPPDMCVDEVVDRYMALQEAMPVAYTVRYDFDWRTKQAVMSADCFRPRGEPQRPGARGKPWGGHRQARRAAPCVGRMRGALWRLLMLFVSLLLVASLPQVAASPWQRAPTQPPIGGSFRPCP